MIARQSIFMVITAALALSWVAAVAAAPSQLPATGQKTCWDSNGKIIPCAGTGQDGEIRAGAKLRYKDKGDGTIKDKNTGLQWEKKSNDGTIHDVNKPYTWEEAFAVHVAGLNTANFAGHNDWRLPNVKELQSIVNYEKVNPSVSRAFNTNCVPNATVLTGSCTVMPHSTLFEYWSSTTFANSPTSAWGVFFLDGQVGPLANGKKSSTFHVRAVRGGSAQLPATGQKTCWDSNGKVIPCAGTGQDGEIRAGARLRYKDKGDGTIEDKNTGLQWEKKSNDGTIHDVNKLYTTWEETFTVHVAGLNTANFAGHNDWRLPNVKELQSIVNYEKVNPSVSRAFNTNCVPNATVLTGSCTETFDGRWGSSTTGAFSPGTAQLVNFFYGLVVEDGKGFPLHVRAVRGGLP